MADLIRDMRAQLGEQIAALDAQRAKLRTAFDALGEVTGNAESAPPQATRRGRPAVNGTETRDAQALAFVQKHPGSAIKEIAKGIGLPEANYLYRVMPKLVEQGAVRREEGKFFPV